MHSVKHHLAYWAISASASVVYEIASKLGIDVVIFRLLLAPLAVYALRTVWYGPQSQPQRFSVVATWCLLVSLRATIEYFRVPSLDTRPIRGFIHALFSFTVLGVLEPIRQNVSWPSMKLTQPPADTFCPAET